MDDKKMIDIIDEYAYDLDRYETYEDLVSALEDDDRIPYEPQDALYLELASDIISKGEGVVCDRCSAICPMDSAFDTDYAENEDDDLIAAVLLQEEDGEYMCILCPDCAKELFERGKNGNR